MEEEYIFKMDEEQQLKYITIEEKINYSIETTKYNNYHKKLKKNSQILSISPTVSFTNYKPPPSSSYTDKLNNLLKLYKIQK